MGSKRAQVRAYVYALVHMDSERMYIGKAREPAKRWRQHIDNADMPREARKSRSLIAEAIHKYGAEAFAMFVVGEYASDDRALAEEERLIAAVRAADREFGFNLSRGQTDGWGRGWCGESLGWLIEEQRREMALGSVVPSLMADEAIEQPWGGLPLRAA